MWAEVLNTAEELPQRSRVYLDRRAERLPNDR
jgi:hypothetical protein